MGGSGEIAVINVEKCAYLGKICGSKPNVRHLICKDGYLYASINTAGYVQRCGFLPGRAGHIEGRGLAHPDFAGPRRERRQCRRCV